MAQQAILAANARRREDAADGAGFLRRRIGRKPKSLREALAANEERLAGLFDMWDVDGDGELDTNEFKRALQLLGLKVTQEQYDRFVAECDTDKSGTLNMQEFNHVIAKEKEAKREAARNKAVADEEAEDRRSLPVRLFCSAWGVVNSLSVQTFLYLLIVLIFQLITQSVRLREEVYLDLSFHESILDNKFDTQLNKFSDIRREADIWEYAHAIFSALLSCPCFHPLLSPRRP